MEIKYSWCNTCIHNAVCTYREKFTNFIVENYPVIVGCQAYDGTHNYDWKETED